MEESKKDYRIYGFLNVIYGIILLASVPIWLGILKGTGGESIGHMCIVFPSIIAIIMYFIAGLFILSERYDDAKIFAGAGLIFLIPVWVASQYEYFALSLILYLIIPVILIICNIWIDKKTGTPPPASP